MELGESSADQDHHIVPLGQYLEALFGPGANVGYGEELLYEADPF